MVSVNVDQNTDDWLRIRRGGPLHYGTPVDPMRHFLRVGGSEVASICGLCPFRGSKPHEKFQQILHERWDYLQGKRPDGLIQTAPMTHGHIAEPSTLAVYQQQMRNHPCMAVPCTTTFDAATLCVDDGGYFYNEAMPTVHGCSPDGLVVCKLSQEDRYQRLRLVEAKSPWGPLYPRTPSYYIPQVQYQMWVTGISECDFVAVKFPQCAREEEVPPVITGEETFMIHRYQIDIEFCEWMAQVIEHFSAQLREATHKDAQYTAPSHLPPAPSLPKGDLILEKRPVLSSSPQPEHFPTSTLMPF